MTKATRGATTLLIGCLILGSLPCFAGLSEVRARGRLIMLCWPHQESQFVRRMIKEYEEEGLHRFAGIDVDVLRAYASSLGVELEVRPVSEGFSTLIPVLLAGEGDVIGSSLTITEKRKQKVDFSAPYYKVQKVVVVGERSDILEVDDLAAHTAATVAGSSHEEHLLMLSLDKLRFHHTLFTLENYEAVAEGAADFTVVDSTSASRSLAKYPEFGRQLKVAFSFPHDDHYGFAVGAASDLLESLNAFLSKLEHSGELERIVARHTVKTE